MYACRLVQHSALCETDKRAIRALHSVCFAGEEAVVDAQGESDGEFFDRVLWCAVWGGRQDPGWNEAVQ